MRHVIWDWNGTLADDLPVVIDAVNVSLAAVGEQPIEAEDYRNHYTRPVREFYNRLLARPISDAEWSTIDNTFHKTYVDWLDRVPLARDAEEAINRIRAAGAIQSILSMWWHDDLVPEVRRHGIHDAMVRIDGNTEDAGESKARLLEFHLEALQANGSAVMIGDAIDDAEAAKAVGVPIIMYDGGSHHWEELEALQLPIAGSLVEAVEKALSL